MEYSINQDDPIPEENPNQWLAEWRPGDRCWFWSSAAGNWVLGIVENIQENFGVVVTSLDQIYGATLTRPDYLTAIAE
jgi:hypothetical protein